MKNSIKFTLFFIFTLVFAFEAQAQNSEWIRIESENKEISFAVPNNFSFVFDKEGFTRQNPQNWREIIEYKNIRSLSAYDNGTTMFFESYDVKNGKKAVAYLLPNLKDAQITSISFENFSGFQIISEKTIYTAFYYLASENHIYYIGVGAHKKSSESVYQFLNSIKLEGKSVFNLPTERVAETKEILSIVNLPETPIEIEYNKMTKEEKKDWENKRKDVEKTKISPLESKSDDGEKLTVLFKPAPDYTDYARKSGEQGKVLLKATFSPNGSIGKVVVLQGLRYGLTENSIRVLKRVKFIPAEKDKSPISVTRTIEYNFIIYSY